MVIWGTVLVHSGDILKYRASINTPNTCVNSYAQAFVPCEEEITLSHFYNITEDTWRAHA